jgi:hypothetical protein
MDSKLILEAARGTLDGTLSFPEVVGQLLAAGVEYYHVDYVGFQKRGRVSVKLVHRGNG